MKTAKLNKLPSFTIKDGKIFCDINIQSPVESLTDDKVKFIAILNPKTQEETDSSNPEPTELPQELREQIEKAIRINDKKAGQAQQVAMMKMAGAPIVASRHIARRSMRDWVYDESENGFEKQKPNGFKRAKRIFEQIKREEQKKIQEKINQQVEGFIDTQTGEGSERTSAVSPTIVYESNQ